MAEQLSWQLNIPYDAEDQRVYIDEAQTEGERLARQWECDSVNSGRRPYDDTPLEIGKARMRQFWAWFGDLV